MSATGQIPASSAALEPPTSVAPPGPRSRPAMRALVPAAVGPAAESLPGFSPLELEFFRRGDELDSPAVAA
jgi:hypothetical protein